MGPAFSLATTLGVMVAAAGALTPWALLAMTAIMLLVALTFAQLAARFPDAGSSYAWARRAFGEGAGAYTAWILVIANFFAVLATTIPAGIYTLALFAPGLTESPPWEAGVGAIWIAACALILYLGMRPSARVAAALLFAELVILAASAVASLLIATPAAVASANVLPPVGASGFIAAMVLGIWMVDGWEVSASTSEETSGASKTAGSGGIIGLMFTAAFLVVCTLAYLHVGGVAGLEKNQVDVLAFVGERLGGLWKTILVATVLVSLAAALETTLLYLVRSVYAMGRDGVLPRALGRLGERTRDPDVALAVVTVAVIAATLLVGLVPTASAGLTLVLSGTAVFLGLLFLTSCAAALRLFDKEPPFYAAIAGAALLVVLGIAIVQAPASTRWCVGIGLTLGLPIAAVFTARKRAGKVGAPAARNIGG
jgi:amino acid transporter